MRHAIVIVLTMLLGPWALPARADVYVVVNPRNPVQAMTQKEVLNLFMGRVNAFTEVDLAMPLDLPRDHAVRDHFYHLLTGMTPAQVNSYWSRLMFTGRTLPPKMVASEAALVEAVRRNPGAIGYLSQEPADPGVRVVLVLKDTP